jgi:hypothetical protein
MHNAKGKGGSSKRRMRKEGRAEGRKGSRSGIGLSGDDIKGIVCQLSYITQSHACSRFEERWKEDTGFILLFDREGRKSRNILLSWSVHLEKIYLDRLSYGPTDWVSLSLPLSFSLSFFLSLPLSLSLSYCVTWKSCADQKVRSRTSFSGYGYVCCLNLLLRSR